MFHGEWCFNLGLDGGVRWDGLESLLGKVFNGRDSAIISVFLRTRRTRTDIHM